MKEGFDLNSLRAIKPSEGVSRSGADNLLSEALERDRQMSEGTVEERIAALELEISRLEEERKRLSPIEAFDALTPEEQQAQMRRELEGLVPEEEWDLSIYRAGLMRDSKKNPHDLRIAVARAKLKALKGE